MGSGGFRSKLESKYQRLETVECMNCHATEYAQALKWHTNPAHRLSQLGVVSRQMRDHSSRCTHEQARCLDLEISERQRAQPRGERCF